MVRVKKLEYVLIAAVLGLLAVAIFGPAVVQPEHQHAFADQRMRFGIPFAMDVLSNLSFAAWGLVGMMCLCALVKRTKPSALVKRSKISAEHALAGLFFAGLVITAAASSYYHWQPDDSGLGVDRLGMVVEFAGLLGLAVANCISHRGGVATAAAMLLLGPLSVWCWLASSNVLPWLVIQFGGMALILWMAFIKPAYLPLTGGLPVRWGVVVLVYAVAKLFELADHQIYQLTSQAISGHSLKHVAASFAAWPVLIAIESARGVTQNQGRIHVGNSDRSVAH